MFFRISILTGMALASCAILTGCADSAPDTTGTPSATSMASEAAAGVDATAREDKATASASETNAESGALGPGSPAPPISIAKWMKGEPVESFSSDKVYVVEFWATWCGPCLQSMPHMAALQTEYGDKVTFIGVSDEDEATVGPFLEKKSDGEKTWSDILTYTIALDDEQKTNMAYMKAANQGGIPCAFIVGKTGNVEWIGHPMSMDQPLQQVVDGSWDSEAARKEFLAAAENERIMNEYMPRLAGAANSGDYAEAVKVCDEILEKHPEMPRINQIRMSLLLQGGMIKEFNKAAADSVEANLDDSTMLNQIAWTLADSITSEDRDLDLALKASLRAAELTEEKDGSVLDTVARVYAERGNLEEAIAWQKKAIAASTDTEDLAATLADYEARAKGGDETTEVKEKPAEEKPAAVKPAEEKPEPPQAKEATEDAAESDKEPQKEGE